MGGKPVSLMSARVRLFLILLLAVAGSLDSHSAWIQDEGREGEAQTSQDDGDETRAKSRLTVRVVDRNSGVEIPGARVELSGAARGSAQTDSRGVAMLSDLDRGQVSVEVSADGWTGLKESFLLDEYDEEISLSLLPLETRLTVKVVGREDDGREVSVPGCTVKIFRRGGNAIVKKTDDSGTAVFSNLARGEIRVNVMAENWETGFEKTMLAHEEASVEIHLRRSHPPGDGRTEMDTL